MWENVMDTLHAGATSNIITAIKLKHSERNQEPSGCGTDNHSICSLNHDMLEEEEAIGIRWFTALGLTSKMCLGPSHEHAKK